MSSEGSRTSSSSRLSQFGLYRTIDARTEEFLKLSKKRQIRRGCACAVISTAITVTVVVAVILIYEYNSSLDSKHEKESLKCTNTTKSVKQISSREEHKENKKSHTINLSTVKLLNLLLRALNHTPNFENQMDDSPTTDKLVATEPDIPFERNVFSNSKNWIRIPSIRMLAAEHKDPSIFYYRNPTSNVKLTQKARNTPPYFEMDLHSEEILDKTTKSSIRKKYQAISNITIQPNPIIETTSAPPTSTSQKPKLVLCPDTDGQNKICNCNKQNLFMCRLLSNIQELFPEIILNTSCIANNTGTEKPKIKALKTSHKSKVTITTPEPQLLAKNETSTSNYDIQIFDDATAQYNIAENMTAKYQRYLDNTTVQIPATESTTETYQNNFDKTTNISVYSNKNYNQDAALNNIKSFLQSIIHITTKQPDDTTKAVRTYILPTDVVEYTPHITTTPFSIGSEYKTAEKILATKSIEYEFELVDTNKTDVYNSEHFVGNRNKTMNATKSKKHHKISDKSSVYSNKNDNQDAALNNIKSFLQSIIHNTTKQPDDTTTAVRTYILPTDVVEYTPHITTTPFAIGSEYKTAEKILATKSIEYELVDTNKTDVYSSEHFVGNRNKTINATKSKNHYKISDKKQEPVIIDEVTSKYAITADMYKEYKKYSLKNTNKLSNVSKSGHQHSVQNKRPKIFLKGQIQTVTRTSTTTTAKPSILVPELVIKHIEPFIKSTTSTTTSAAVTRTTKQNKIDYTRTTTKQNKIDYKLDIENEFERMTESTVNPSYPSTTAKYFVDNPYAAIRPFNKIKFARFDRFVANPSKRVKLPLYKDINFDLFPIYKRRNAPKFDSIENKKDESLISFDNLNNAASENGSTNIGSSRKKDGNLSTLSIIPINSSKSHKDNSDDNRILAIKMINDSSEESTKEEDEGRKSEIHKNYNLPKSSSVEEKHAIWTYTIDTDYDDNKTKDTVDSENKESETPSEPMKKIILFDDTNISKSESTERTVSISQLYDADESLQNYLNRITPLKTKEGDERKLNNISHTVEAKFFEDRIQEKLRSHMDKTAKANCDPDNTIQSVIPIEVLVDETKYNPLSMLPKSRPSYLEINRNFLGDDYEPDYQINKENSKQKRQDYDIVFDLYE